MRTIAIVIAASLLMLPTANAASAGFRASGEAVAITGPDPFEMSQTARIRGAVMIVEDSVHPAVLAGHDAHHAVSLHAEFVVSKSKYTIMARRLQSHWLHTSGTGEGSLPVVGPRLIATGWGLILRNGRVLAASAPIAVTVMTDPPVRGIDLEVSTVERSLPGVRHGYLHVWWFDPAVFERSGPRVSARCQVCPR